MKRVIIRDLIIAVIIVLLCAATAFAQMKVGEVVNVHGMPVCDTQEQARDVVGHGKKGGVPALLARLRHYNDQVKDGVPACGILNGQVAIMQILFTEKVGNDMVTVIVIMVPEGHLFVGLTTLKVGAGQST
jgi:hypothetical protein